jgi:hypothetical protein
MNQKTKLLLILLLFGQTVSAQQKFPVIKADSIAVDIKDGDDFTKAAWFISPKTKPDIYKTPNKSIHKITFYTNKDSISFIVKPHEKYNFIILLNNKDSALTQILYEPTYMETLKNGSKYDLTDNRPLPDYYYKPVNDSSLVNLRKRLKLDSIAGTGDEVLKVLNLLHWLHNSIIHDGERAEPPAKNFVELLSICKKENRGLCCGTLSEILNDCYLSMGFKSRRVICLPKDSLGIDPDCHSINVVYLNTLKKWVWIDPTYNAYIMNEKGDLLSIEEVRERIINNMPLILNPDENWNNVYTKPKDEYFYNYMAKNLYILRCYNGQEKNSQGKVISTAIELIPLDYFKQKPDKVEETQGNFKCLIYRTNNPNKFWQTP